MADTADITVQFGDGSSHTYTGVPSNVTPDQVEARASKEFAGLKVTHLDRKLAAAATPVTNTGGGTQQSQSTPPKKPLTGLQTAVGIAETGLSAATGFAGEVVTRTAQVADEAGKAIADPIRKALGLSVYDPTGEKGRAEFDRYRQKMTYAPRSEGGQRVANNVAKVTEPIGKFIDKPAAALEEHGMHTAADVYRLGVDALGSDMGGSAKSAVAAATKAAPKSVAARVQDIATNLSGGATRQEVGAAAKKSLSATEEAARKAGNKAYTELDEAMPAGHPVDITKTRDALKAAGQGLTVDPKVKAVIDKVKDSKTISFQDVKELRTKVNDAVGYDRSATDRTLKGIAKAMSDDINAAADKLGPEAKAKWEAANKQWAAYKEAQKGMQEVMGKKWQGKTNEAIYDRLFQKGKNSASEIGRVTANMDADTKRMFVGSVIHKMADAGGGEFNADKFLSNWKKMDPQARATLFGSVGGGYAENLSRLTENLQKIQEGKAAAREVFGHGQEMTGAGIIAALLYHAGQHELAGAVGALAVGQRALKAVGNIPEMSAAALEKVLTNPRTVRVLKNSSEVALRTGVTAAKGAAAAGRGMPREPEEEEHPALAKGAAYAKQYFSNVEDKFNALRQFSTTGLTKGTAEGAGQQAATTVRELSEVLLKAGVPGIKYLDALSRSAEKGTRNLVLIDPSIARIIKREE